MIFQIRQTASTMVTKIKIYEAMATGQLRKMTNLIAFCSPFEVALIVLSYLLNLQNWQVRTWWCGGCVHIMQRQAQRYKQPKKNWNWIAFCSPDSKTIRSCINHTFILTLPNWPARTRWCGGCVQVMQRQACADLYCVPPPAYGTPCNVLLSTDYLQFLEVKKIHFPAHF